MNLVVWLIFYQTQYYDFKNGAAAALLMKEFNFKVFFNWPFLWKLSPRFCYGNSLLLMCGVNFPFYSHHEFWMLLYNSKIYLGNIFSSLNVLSASHKKKYNLRVELLFFFCLVYILSSLIFSTLFQSHAKCILVLIFGLVCYLLQICEMQIPVVSSVIYNCSCIVADTIFCVFETARKRQPRKILWDLPWSQYQCSGECFCLDRISTVSPLCWKYHLCLSLFFLPYLGIAFLIHLSDSGWLTTLLIVSGNCRYNKRIPT